VPVMCATNYLTCNGQVWHIDLHTNREGKPMTDAQAIKELMENFNKVQAIIKANNPDASEEEVHQMTSAAFNQLLGL
jgi:hypothetical protein